MTQPKHNASVKPNRLFQTSTITALLDAVIDGEMTQEELLVHGDFGLGTFNGLDGEMIVSEGVVHQFKAEGVAAEPDPTLLTPFACVTFFKPEQTINIDKPMDKAAFEALVDKMINNPNLFAAVRFRGTIETIDTRTVPCQCRPYPNILEVFASQPKFTMKNISAVMLGFRVPPYMASLNEVGYHLHVLTDDQKLGGHVIDYRITSGVLEVARMSEMELSLPLTKEFAEANLASGDLEEAMNAVQGRGKSAE